MLEGMPYFNSAFLHHLVPEFFHQEYNPLEGHQGNFMAGRTLRHDTQNSKAPLRFISTLDFKHLKCLPGKLRCVVRTLW
jgi:hypothetical protein